MTTVTPDNEFHYHGVFLALSLSSFSKSMSCLTPATTPTDIPTMIIENNKNPSVFPILGILLYSYTSCLSSSQYTVPRFLMFFVPLWPALHISNRLFHISWFFVSHFMSQIVLCKLFTDKILFLPPFHLFTFASKNFQT